MIEDGWRVVTANAGPVGLTVAEPLTFDFPVKERRVEVDLPATLEDLLPAPPPPDRARSAW